MAPGLAARLNVPTKSDVSGVAARRRFTPHERRQTRKARGCVPGPSLSSLTPKPTCTRVIRWQTGWVSAWQPLRQRTQPEDVLYEGVPTWLQPSLSSWVNERISAPTGGSEMLLRLVRVLQWDVGSGANLWDELDARLNRPDELLDIIHYFLGREPSDPYRGMPLAVAEMALCLLEAGSAWTVDRLDGEHWGLVRRLPAEIGNAVDSVASVADRSGEHLRSARAHLYGRGPNPSEAYSDSVKAVEAAAKPVVIPKSPAATLGTIRAAIRDAPEGKFSFAITSRQGNNPRKTLVAMLGLLYEGQRNRHGDPEGPASVGQEEADAAFHLAVTLVHLFRTGTIRSGDMA